MKKCFGFGCIFSANNLHYSGDLVIDINDGTIFLTNISESFVNLTPWLTLISFKDFQTKFEVNSMQFNIDICTKFNIPEDIKIKIKRRYNI